MADEAGCYVVVGATGGIGSALAKRLAKQGVPLVVLARRAEPLQALADELQAHAYPLDATQWDNVDACFTTLVERYGSIRGVAHCVGSLLLKPAHATREADWHATVAANLTSAFAIVRASTQAMLNTGGAIALVSSVAARVGLANHEAIAACKAGIIGLTLSAAATYASKGIRVNAVAPGLVRTPLTTSLTENPAVLKASTALHPLGRIGEADEVAAALEWLLLPAQGWITGQVLGVDGGLATVRSK